MWAQTFSLGDIPKLITLLFLEGILSIDNALALALIVRRLPESKRQRALFIGLASAFALRAFGVLGAAYIIQLLWVQILGGAYLLYLSLSHLYTQRRNATARGKKRSFWATVARVEVTDFIFAVDSILAGLALIGASAPQGIVSPKIWIVYTGGILGVIMMRFAARLFINLLSRFPRLELGAHLIVGWIGLKLVVESLMPPLPNWFSLLFWVGIACFFLFGFTKKQTTQ